ncbi:MAG: lipoyltransferase [Chloroflexi bacterium]|nr:MAG: lipoyltransferase [Chloroflexota bacterium]
MPRIVSDIADAFVFRKIHARPQFLLLLRRHSGPMGGAWQAIHAQIDPDETAVQAVLREVQDCTGLTPLAVYSADFVSQIYDHSTDALVLSPAFALEVSPQLTPVLSPAFVDHAWCDLEETTARLPWTSQRWAVRHIYDVIALGGDEAELYRIA